jgi:hypothetical protein
MSNIITIKLTLRDSDYEKNKELFEFSDMTHTDNCVDEDDLMTFDYHGVDYFVIGIEERLQAEKIPYSKEWTGCNEFSEGEEHCRILPNGTVDIKKPMDATYNIIDDAISAHENGDITSFLAKKKDAITIMSWAAQNIIMVARECNYELMQRFDDAELDGLVDNMSSELANTNTIGDEDLQEEALLMAEKRATQINNQGRSEQINFLLNNGFLPAGC